GDDLRAEPVDALLYKLAQSDLGHAITRTAGFQLARQNIPSDTARTPWYIPHVVHPGQSTYVTHITHPRSKATSSAARRCRSSSGQRTLTTVPAAIVLRNRSGPVVPSHNTATSPATIRRPIIAIASRSARAKRTTTIPAWVTG